MAAYAGRKVKLEWGGAEVPGVREKGVTLNGEAIDITSDDDDGWRELLDEAAENQVDISLSGVTKSKVLMTDWFAGNRTKAATLTYPDGEVISGTFRMSTYSETGTYNDATTFESTLQSTGVVTFTPAP